MSIPEYTTPPLKTCTKCKRELPVTDEHFSHRRSAKDGRSGSCKACDREHKQKYRAEHRAELAEIQRQYVRDNPEKARENKRRYRAAHREEEKAASAAYRAAHPEETRQAQRKYHAANLDECRERSRRYRQEHLEEMRAKDREQYAQNREAQKKRKLDYYYENREEMLEANRRWIAANPEKNRARYSRRRALVKNAEGSYTAEDTVAQYERQKGKCFYCGVDVGDDYHVDHVVPLSKGGTNGPENLVVACPHCNLSKYAKHPMEFAGMLL